MTEWENYGVDIDWPERYVLDFYSTTCQPCMQMMKILPKWEQDTGVMVVKVDIEKEPQLATDFGIRKVPTFVYFADGKEAGRHVGVARLSELTEMVEV